MNGRGDPLRDLVIGFPPPAWVGTPGVTADDALRLLDVQARAWARRTRTSLDRAAPGPRKTGEDADEAGHGGLGAAVSGAAAARRASLAKARAARKAWPSPGAGSDSAEAANGLDRDVTDIDPHAFDLAPLKDIASALSVSRSTIIRRARAGEIPCARVGAGWRFPLRLILDVWVDDPGGAMVIWRRRASASPAEDASADGPASSPYAPEIARDYPVAAAVLAGSRSGRGTADGGRGTARR